MKNHITNFIPAAHYHSLTPFYGFFMKLFFGRHYKNLAKIIHLKPGEKLLDVGCGPGNLLENLRKLYPQNKLVGLDVDPSIIKIAQKKLSNTTLYISSATNIPEADNSFDVVISTLMIHHLNTNQRKEMLSEVHRTLKSGGRFLLFDFAQKPNSLFGKLFVRLFRQTENLDEALEGKYPIYMKEAGFQKVHSTYKAYGMLELLVGSKKINV